MQQQEAFELFNKITICRFLPYTQDDCPVIKIAYGFLSFQWFCVSFFPALIVSSIKSKDVYWIKDLPSYILQKLITPVTYNDFDTM